MVERRELSVKKLRRNISKVLGLLVLSPLLLIGAVCAVSALILLASGIFAVLSSIVMLILPAVLFMIPAVLAYMVYSSTIEFGDR